MVEPSSSQPSGVPPVISTTVSKTISVPVSGTAVMVTGTTVLSGVSVGTQYRSVSVTSAARPPSAAMVTGSSASAAGSVEP